VNWLLFSGSDELGDEGGIGVKTLGVMVVR
jgi:hypothetical protein